MSEFNDTIYYIPHEILEVILFDLDYDSIINFCMTNKYNYCIFMDESFWCKLLRTKITKNKLDRLIKRYALDNYQYKYRKIAKRFLTQSIDHASIYKYKLDEYFKDIPFIDGLKCSDQLFIKYNIDKFTVFRGDILLNISNCDTEDFNGIEFCMFDIINNNIVLISNNSHSDYASPNRVFTFPDYPADYWVYYEMIPLGDYHKDIYDEDYYYNYDPCVAISNDAILDYYIYSYNGKKEVAFVIIITPENNKKYIFFLFSSVFPNVSIDDIIILPFTYGTDSDEFEKYDNYNETLDFIDNPHITPCGYNFNDLQKYICKKII